MAVGINKVQRPKSNQSGNFLSTAGQVIGAIKGGPAGAAAGGAIGSALGGGGGQKPSVEPIESTAMSRRMALYDNSGFKELNESLDSLKHIQDPQLRDELAKPLVAANQLARTTRG